MSFCSDSVNEYFKFYEKCRSRLGKAGFNFRKFESNSVDLNKLINETNFQSKNVTKVLGLFIFSFSESFKSVAPFPTRKRRA